jgi:hypothetical protein
VEQFVCEISNEWTSCSLTDNKEMEGGRDEGGSGGVVVRQIEDREQGIRFLCGKLEILTCGCRLYSRDTYCTSSGCIV